MAQSEAVVPDDVASTDTPILPAASTISRSLRLCLLSLIVIIGIALRFWGIAWSLPDSRHPLASYHPDETIDFMALEDVDLVSGRFDLGFYSYGTFYFYLVDVAKTIGQGDHLIAYAPPLPVDSPPLSDMQNAARELPETRGTYLVGRIVSALAGVFTIPVLFALGRRLYGEKVGLTAALLYAVLPLAVVHAHFFTVDVTATLFVSLALLWSARLLESQSWKEYLVAGVWTGLAAATKYSAGLVVVAPIAAHLLSSPRANKGYWRLPGPLALLSATAVTFLIACPGPLINWDAFWNGQKRFGSSGLRYELFEHSRLGHGLLFVNTGPGWWYHLVISLRYGMGLPMLLLVITGLLSAIGAKTKQDRLLLWFVLIFYGITGLSAVRFARYMIPLYPALSVLVARRVWQVKPRNVGSHAVPITFALLVALTAGYTISLVHAMAVKDPRDAAADYIDGKAPTGATVAFAKIPWYFSPPLSPWFGVIDSNTRKRCTESTRYRFLLPQEESEFDEGVLTPPPDFVVVSNIETTNELRLHQTAPDLFVKSIPSNYQKTVFAPPTLFDMAFSGDLIPDDLLYILPRITVYEKPR